MTPAGIFEAVTVAEKVAAPGEAVVSVDLATVSQQLDQMLTWQMVQFCTLCVLIGVILGVAFARVVGKTWS